MAFARARLLYVVWISATLAHASDEYRKWLSPCAREGFEAIFQRNTYEIRGPIQESLRDRKGNYLRLEAEGAIQMNSDRKPRLALNFKTRVGDTRSPFLKGAEQFDSILRFFEGEYVGINAMWYAGDNLAEFNRLTGPAHNLSLVEAARRTWTGQQALKHGFTDVKIARTKGSPGKYSHAEVYFDHPTPKLVKRVYPFGVEMNGNSVKFDYTAGEHLGQAIHAHVEGDVLVLEVTNRRRALPDVAEEHVTDILEYFWGRYRYVRYKLTGLSKKTVYDPVDSSLAKSGFSK